MATNSSQLQETILKAIDAVVTQRNNDLKLDKTITGIVKKNVGTKHGNPLYQIEYSGGIIEAVAQNSEDIYSPHTSVYVLVPQGNFSNEKIIIGRASSISTDRSSSVVAAAVNNYSIIGANLLESLDDESIKNKKFGLHSFHPVFRDNDPEHGINHRAYFVYQKNSKSNTISFSDDRLNIYKENANAIMVKADFLTNLDSIQKQQPNARYGLIFNFAFDNLNKGYGETNGEILENISQIVRGKILNEAGIAEEKLLYDYIVNFENRLNNSQNDNIAIWITNNTGLIDQTIENIQSIYNCFKIDYAKLDKEIINNTIQSFLILLNELKYKNTISDIALRYNEWKEEIVGDESQKYTQFVLSSDDMIGNPFNFNTWNTQYAVFNIDLETFNHLESILFYKEGFFVDTEGTEDNPGTNYEAQWPIGDGGQPDIFVRNLQIYAMNPLDNQSGDYTLNVEPYADSDIFISADNPSTKFKATLLRKLYEDLTANGKVSYLWFKEDSSVINSNSVNYHYLGGSGWRKLEHNETNYLFTTTINENHAYKNNYKCVAIYEPTTDDKTILSFTFSVYNKDMSIDIKLESDLGTHFSFDAGAPIVKVLINEDRENPNSQYQELGYNESIANPNYLYCWTIDDAANGYTLFLDEIFDTVIQESVQEAIVLSSKQSLLKRIKTYILEELTDQANRATRIKYPVSIASSGFTITCYVKQYKNGQYYDIGSASLEFENQNDSVAAGYRIHIVNGDQVFQYDEYGNTPCSEKKKNPLTIKPLQAKLFTPSGLEVEGTNYQVEWIFPIESTMIKTAETLQLNPSTNLVQSYTGSEVNFTINDLYDPNAYANQITCHVHFGDVDYYKDTNFYFGKQGNNGTNGTDTVAKIEYNGVDAANILHYQPLTLYVQKKADASAQGMLNIGARTLQDNVILAKTNFSTKEDEGILKIAIYQKETLIGPDNYKTGYPKWNIAGNASETRNNTGKFFEIASSTEDIRLIWHYDYNQDKNYRMQNIRTSVQLTDDQMYYAFFSLPIIEYEPSILEVNALLPINRISIDKDFYLNEIVYNQDGRNPVYNHNQGLKLYNIPSNITKIIWMAKGGLTNEENNPWISLLEERNSDNGQLILETIPQNNTSIIYVLPKDIFDGSATNNRVEAKLYENDKLIATVYAPINMTLNTFGLTSLNAWDGNTVTIDNDGGYVMAPQIGAGEKDNHNRFTGVLMGKTETYTGGGDNEKQIGLFGYANGLQSIFLDSETGNATFGLPDVDSERDENGEIIYKNYHNTNVQGSDDYGEGRIELRPGAISKIGGWRIGRRSLYYTTKPTSDNINNYHYEYDGEIGPSYSGDIGTPLNKDYAEHHDKDIKTEDGGLLLSAAPPYISVKGEKLTAAEIDNGLNSQLMAGDSLEIQLDPKTPTLFTIFRHNSMARSTGGKRQFLAGINDKGELLANGVGKEDESGTGTKSGNIILKAFEDTKDQESGSYVGAVFESGNGLASTRTFFQIFRSKMNPLDTTAQVYMTGGQVTSSGEMQGTGGNEYLRPISIHGQNVMLYAKNGTTPYNKPVTDANIQIATNESQIQLGNTKLHLTRNSENDLETRGNLNIDLGAEGTRKSLNINALDDEINLFTGTTNYFNQKINNSDGIKITTSKQYEYNSSNDNYKIQLGTNKLDMTTDKILFGSNNENYTNLITMDQDNSEWKIGNDLSLITVNHLKILATNNGNGSQYNSQDDFGQILIQAGSRKTNESATQLFLNSSNNTWTTGSSGTGTETGSKTNSWFRVNTTRTNNGIYLYDKIDNDVALTYFHIDAKESDFSGGIRIQGTVDSNPISGVNTGLTVTNSIYTSAKYYGSSSHAICDGTSSSGKGATISGLGDSGTATFSSVELQSNGRPKLHTHDISVSIPSGSTIYNAIKDSIGSQISSAISNALKSYAKKSDLSDYAKKGTYHLNSGGQIPTAINAGGSITSTSSTQNFYVTL